MIYGHYDYEKKSIDSFINFSVIYISNRFKKIAINGPLDKIT